MTDTIYALSSFQEHTRVGALALAVLGIALLVGEALGDAAPVAAFGALELTCRAADDVTSIADRLFTVATERGSGLGAAAVRRKAPPVSALTLAGTALIHRDA